MSHPIATVILPSVDAGRARTALRSLAAQTAEHETVVIDNGSPAGAVSAACGEFGFARPVRVEENLGFSRAVNLAAREALTDVLVLVNDDAVYDPGFVGAIAGALDPSAGVTMAAGVMRQTDQRLIDTAGIEADRTLLAFDYLNGEPLATADGAPDPLGPSGVAAGYDRAAFARLGGMDEGIFAYFEDLDLALRMRLAGHGCRLVRAAGGTHQHSRTLGSGSPEKNRLMGFSRGYLLRKWGVVNARRAFGIGVREVVICAGQAVFDRSLAGVRGRRAGWVAAGGGGSYPAAAFNGRQPPTLRQSLGRRLRRRARIRGER